MDPKPALREAGAAQLALAATLLTQLKRHVWLVMLTLGIFGLTARLTTRCAITGTNILPQQMFQLTAKSAQTVVVIILQQTITTPL